MQTLLEKTENKMANQSQCSAQAHNGNESKIPEFLRVVVTNERPASPCVVAE
jgi:hypothetical protein